MGRKIVAAALPLALLATAPAAAQNFDFKVCDGFDTPTANSDGSSGNWGLLSRLNQEPDLANEEAALKSCNAALASPLLRPQWASRRTMLLRAKAAHQLALKRNAEALVTLDQADNALATLPDSYPLKPLIATGNDLLRAYADYALDRPEAARALLSAIEKAHPYSSRIMTAARGLRIGFDPEPGQVRIALLARAPANPAMVEQLFWLNITFGDFGEALRLRPQVSFELPAGRGNWRVSGAKDRKYDLIANRADLDGAAAYALAATGQGQAASAALANARRDLTAATAPSGGSDHGLFAWANDEGTKKLDLWAAAIALRDRAPRLTVNEFTGAVEAANLRQLPIMIDLLERFKPASPPEQAAAQRTLKELERVQNEALRKADGPGTFDLLALFQGLQRPGFDHDVPQFGAASYNSLNVLLSGGAGNGFFMKKEPRSPYLNVGYGDAEAPKWAIEDLALLAAATYANQAGKDSFLVDSRMMVDRETRVAVNFRPTSTRSDGSELRFRILPVNTAELSPALESQRWRLIAVRDVMRELDPIYRPGHLELPPARR